MKRESWLILIAAAVLCGGGVAVWWLGAQPPREGASIEIGTKAGVTTDEHSLEVRELTEKDSAKELDEKIDEYLGSVKQAYGKQSRDYLDAQERAELDIPVPAVEPMERKAPDLLPKPTGEAPPP